MPGQSQGWPPGGRRYGLGLHTCGRAGEQPGQGEPGVLAEASRLGRLWRARSAVGARQRPRSLPVCPCLRRRCIPRTSGLMRIIGPAPQHQGLHVCPHAARYLVINVVCWVLHKAEGERGKGNRCTIQSRRPNLHRAGLSATQRGVPRGGCVCSATRVPMLSASPTTQALVLTSADGWSSTKRVRGRFVGSSCSSGSSMSVKGRRFSRMAGRGRWVGLGLQQVSGAGPPASSGLPPNPMSGGHHPFPMPPVSPRGREICEKSEPDFGLLSPSVGE